MNDFNLKDRVALVTGGGRGIGKAIALMLASHGVSVALCGRTMETLEETAGQIASHGVEAWPIRADVTELENIENFVCEAAASAGRVDILINNAVGSLSAPFAEQTDAHWQHHLNVKLMAYIRCARLAIEEMKKQGWGRIVNIGGLTARITATNRITNGVVNAGVANFTKHIAGSVAPDNITVNCIHPGFTVTERMKDIFVREAADTGLSLEEIEKKNIAGIPMGRLIQPDDIASAALFFCSPLADIVTGQCIAVDGGTAASVNY